MKGTILVLALCACGGPTFIGVDAGPPPIVPDAGRFAFLTSTRYSGDLKTASNLSSSYVGANALCARHAADAGRGGSWVAFVGSSSNAPASRVSGAGPWLKRLPDGGQTVALASLAAAPVSSVNVDEKGAAVSGDVWSGRAGPGCGDWREETGEGSIASVTPSGGTGWQNVGKRACDLKHSLLCLEQ